MCSIAYSYLKGFYVILYIFKAIFRNFETSCIKSRNYVSQSCRKITIENTQHSLCQTEKQLLKFCNLTVWHITFRHKTVRHLFNAFREHTEKFCNVTVCSIMFLVIKAPHLYYLLLVLVFQLRHAGNLEFRPIK